MKTLPSLKQLEYLTALAETRHFGQAAELCSVTPSTLSAGIRDLEAVLGVPLAERTKRSVMMTPLGQEIAARGGAVLRDAEAIMALVATREHPLTGARRLGVIPTIGPYLLPRVLPKLWQAYPQLHLLLREEKTADLLLKLRRGDLDAAVIALPFETEGLATQVLFDDPFVFACHRTHPLAGETEIAVSGLAAGDLLLLEEGHCLRGHALEACRLKGAPQGQEFAATSLSTLTQMVASGIGATL
ncbi:MAG: LysR substrate-binding domain-containing protein, partial [Magnetospiraceae bacterium]